MPITIKTVETPNPNARQYVLDRPVQEQSKGRYFKATDATDEPLVSALLSIKGADSVMLLPNAVTVNKQNDCTWDEVDPAARKTLEEYFS